MLERIRAIFHGPRYIEGAVAFHDKSYVGLSNDYARKAAALRESLQGRPDATSFALDALYGLFAGLASLESFPPCTNEIQAIRKVRDLAREAGQPYVMPQLYATRILAQKHYGRLPLEAPSVDLGIGDGFTEAIAFAGRELTVGADLFTQNLVRARAQKVAREYVTLDMQTLPFASETFRTTLSIYALYHAPDPAQALREMVRITAPGGTIAFDVPAPAFVEERPLTWLLKGMGLTRSASEFGRSISKPLPPVESYLDWLPGCDQVVVTPFFSLPLMRAVYLFYDLENLIDFSTSEAKERAAMPFIERIVAPLLAADDELAKRGAAWYLIRGRKVVS